MTLNSSSASRDAILNKLRATRNPFPDAPPSPAAYLPVANVADFSRDGLIQQFSTILEGLLGKAIVVDDDKGACQAILGIIRDYQADHALTWDFAHIPVQGLEDALREAGIRTTQPTTHDETRPEVIASIRDAGIGISGADAAIAATGTLVVSTAPGRGRIPTVLPPVHIAVINADQLLPRLEDWLKMPAQQSRATMRNSQNICFITGPSRTGDIEMVMVMGVHGPGKVFVVIKR